MNSPLCGWNLKLAAVEYLVSLSQLSAKFKLTRLAGALAATLVVCTAGVQAQQNMSVEELEAYIAEKKAELAATLEQRNRTAEMQQAVEQQISQKDKRKSEIEQEMRNLCAERESITPGSLQACLVEMNLQPE